jgi:hypothetical protein
MQRITEPPTDTNAGSSISVRGCLRFSSIITLTTFAAQASGKY